MSLPLNQILQGDCIELLGSLPNDSIDLIIADPPYSSGARQTNQLRSRGAMLRAEKWQNEWFGTDNLSTSGFMFFMRGVTFSLFQKAKVGTHFYCFIDWRNYPVLVNTIESTGWRINNLIVWDKEYFGMGRDYRNQHELVIFASKADPKPANRHDIANIIRVKRQKQDFHPTEKPVQLLKTMIEMSSNENEVVLDPFAGSGSTLMAAQELRRKWIGIDINPEYIKAATERLATITNQTTLT